MIGASHTEVGLVSRLNLTPRRCWERENSGRAHVPMTPGILCVETEAKMQGCG